VCNGWKKVIFGRFEAIKLGIKSKTLLPVLFLASLCKQLSANCEQDLKSITDWTDDQGCGTTSVMVDLGMIALGIQSMSRSKLWMRFRNTLFETVREEHLRSKPAIIFLLPKFEGTEATQTHSEMSLQCLNIKDLENCNKNIGVVRLM
jgi:hypothetical protein